MSVSKSTNGGITWLRYSPAPAGYTYALAVDPQNSNIVYAGGNPSLFRTTNSGASWSEAASGLSGFVYDIDINPVSSSIVFAGTPSGVYKSTNSGGSWTNTGCSNVNAVQINPDDTNIIYAGTATGVYKSTSGGGGWQQMNDGLDDTHITSLGIYPGTYLYCGTEDAGMYRWSIEVGLQEDFREKSCSPILDVWPNPMTHKVSLSFSLTGQSRVDIAVYDVTGECVNSITHRDYTKGNYNLTWQGIDYQGNRVPTGIYFIAGTIGEIRVHTKLILLH